MRWQTTCVESSEGSGSRRSIGSRTSARSTQQRWQTHIHRWQLPSDMKAAARDCWGPAQKTISVSQEKLMLCDDFLIFQFWPAMRQLNSKHAWYMDCTYPAMRQLGGRRQKRCPSLLLETHALYRSALHSSLKILVKIPRLFLASCQVDNLHELGPRVS
jgi:hypothetical protein